ncbi:IS4 family transposase, partial [Salmonella enterica]|nr:IS4 family transposase [Salmonella enterica subsp. enterica serovar Typhimurium]
PRKPALRRTFASLIKLDSPVRKTAELTDTKSLSGCPCRGVNQKARVIIVTDAGFQNAWFRHIKSPGWDFIGRIRGNIQMRLDSKGEYWFRRQELQASSKPEYLGPGTLARSEYARCDGHFYLHKKEPKGQKNRRSRCRIERKSQIRDGHSSAKEPWLIFSSTNDFKPREIMKLYSRRMQIEQNFRDEKSERFGFGLRASYSRSAGRMLVMSLLATLRTIVLWLRHCCKVSDEAAFCLIQRPYISKTLLTRRISPRGSP